jgi:uncharacterized protein YidB (DUF937 family)
MMRGLFWLEKGRGIRFLCLSALPQKMRLSLMADKAFLSRQETSAQLGISLPTLVHRLADGTL